MAFIEKTDLEKYMTTTDLEQITGGDDAIITACVDDAMETIRERLQQRYDMDVEFGKTAPNRQRSLLKHTIAVALYYLCERIAFDALPENRVVSYTNAVKWANDGASGTIQLSLEKIADKQSGTAIRYGHASKNNHY